jgi:hypothetical protein
MLREDSNDTPRPCERFGEQSAAEHHRASPEHFMTPFLLDDELAALCFPLQQRAAIKRHLDRLGVPYALRPDGYPVVGRTAVSDRLAGYKRAEPLLTRRDEPDAQALKQRFLNRRQTRGTTP